MRLIKDLEFINTIQFRYNRGLWIKVLNLEYLPFKYLMTEEVKIIDEVEHGFDSIDIEIINKFIGIIVQNLLIGHIPEQIQSDFIIEKSFSQINAHTAYEIFSDLAELTIKDYNSVRPKYIPSTNSFDTNIYSQIEESIFNIIANLDLNFYANCRPHKEKEEGGDKKAHYYKDKSFPCVIGISKKDIIIFWFNK